MPDQPFQPTKNMADLIISIADGKTHPQIVEACRPFLSEALVTATSLWLMNSGKLFVDQGLARIKH